MTRLRRLLQLIFVRLLIVLIALSIGAEALSIMTRTVRLLLIGTVAYGIVFLLVYLPSAMRSHRRITLVVLGIMVLTVGVFAIHMMHGSRTVDTAVLRDTYVKRIHSFHNTAYIWGGETHYGIDCSGLVRTALWEAMLRRAIIEGNPTLLLDSSRFWWRDMTAAGMLHGEHAYTRRIGHAGALATPDTLNMVSGYKLEPGDLAVTDSGCHVMVYTGDDSWTEANPDDGRVVTNKALGSGRGYFGMPVTLMRWWILADRR